MRCAALEYRTSPLEYGLSPRVTGPVVEFIFNYLGIIIIWKEMLNYKDLLFLRHPVSETVSTLKRIESNAIRKLYNCNSLVLYNGYAEKWLDPGRCIWGSWLPGKNNDT